MASWKVTVGPECIAAGSCLGIAPHRFAWGDDGKSHPVRDEFEPDESVLDSAASCPVEAIAVYDADTGERIEP